MLDLVDCTIWITKVLPILQCTVPPLEFKSKQYMCRLSYLQDNLFCGCPMVTHVTVLFIATLLLVWIIWLEIISLEDNMGQVELLYRQHRSCLSRHGFTEM